MASVALGDLQISTGSGQVVDYMVSEAYMNHLTTPSPNMMMAMIDSGANVNLGPPSLATDLGLQLCPHIDTRRIGTAHSDSKLVILGWIFPTGFVHTSS